MNYWWGGGGFLYIVGHRYILLVEPAPTSYFFFHPSAKIPELNSPHNY